MITGVKKSMCTLLAAVTVLTAVLVPAPPKASAASDVTVNLSAEKQVIRGFGGINLPAWIGDLTLHKEKRHLAMVPTSLASRFCEFM